MVEIIQRRQDPSVKIGQQLGGIVESGFKGYNEGQRLKQDAEERSRMGKELGITLSKNPELAKVQLSEALKGKREEDKFKRFQDYVNSKRSSGSPLETSDSDGIQNPYQAEEPDALEKYYLGSIDPMYGQFAAKDEAEARADIRANKKMDQQQKQFEATALQKEKEMHHKETKKYYDTLHEDSKEAKLANQSLLRQKNLVGEMGWRDRIANFLKPEIRNIIQSDSAVEFDSNVTNLIGSKKSKLGGVLTTPKLNLLLSKLATSSKSEEANRYIIDYSMLENDMTIAMQEIADEIIHENNGYRPANFIGMVNERMRNLFQDRADSLVKDVQNLKDDPERLKKVWRRKVQPNTPITREIADKYIEMYEGNTEEAKLAAKEDGYV